VLQRLQKSKTKKTVGVLSPREMIQRNVIQNYDPEKIQGNSIDLRVKDVFQIDGGIVLHKNGDRELPPYRRVKSFSAPRVGKQTNEGPEECFYFKLEPQHLYQIEFEEQVTIPLDVCSITVLRSSMFKSGASGESGLFDSGYSGQTGMTIAVKFESLVEVGAAVAQMIFFSADAAKPYAGYYQQNSSWVNS
jgi:dUTP pyrophosphatase